MKLKFQFVFLSLLFFKNSLTAQNLNATQLIFKPVFNESPLHLSANYYKLNDHDSVQFETLKFYISGLVFLDKGQIVWKEENSFHLIDASKENTLNVVLKTPAKLSYTQVKFNLGIDSVTNYEGAKGGDLDPTKGMYWTWQNGYINFKLEGNSNLCNTENNKFEFHIGGYQYPFNTLQSIVLNVTNQEKIELNIDLKTLMTSVPLNSINLIVDPSLAAVSFSKKAKEIFSITSK